MDYQDSVNQAKVMDPSDTCISYGVMGSGIIAPDTNKQTIDEKVQQVINVDVNGQVSQQEVHSQQNNILNNTNFVVNPIGQQVQNVGAPSSQYFPPSSQPQPQPSQSQTGTMPSNIQTQSMPQGIIYVSIFSLQ